WTKPTGRMLSWTDPQLDSLQPVYFLDKKTSVNLGGVVVALDPQQLGRQHLERADVIVLQAIKDQTGKRPIYYSRTVGTYADQFGLTAYLEGQGFVRKLHDEALAPAGTGKVRSHEAGLKSWIPTMNETDHEPIVSVAFLAALADGRASPEELSQLRSALGRLGMTNLGAVAERVAKGQVPLGEVIRQ